MLNSIIGGFFILLGFVVKRFPDLIAGYNTLSPDRKAEVNIEGLSSHMRNSFIGLGIALIVLNPLLHFLGLQEHISSIFILVILIGVFYMWINAQTYDVRSHAPKSRRNIRIISGSIAFGVLLLILIGALYYSTRPTDIIYENNKIEITGLYGLTAKMDSVELREELPKILRKTNGFAYGSVYKGSFDLEELGKCRLFLFSKEGPFVIVYTQEGFPIIVNYKAKGPAIELYQDIKNELGQ